MGILCKNYIIIKSDPIVVQLFFSTMDDFSVDRPLDIVF